jgi:subtilase family serine protease
VAVTVHNIGSAPAPAFEVALVDSSGKRVAVKRVEGLDASLDLEPKWTSVVLAGRGQRRPAGLSVQVDPDDRIYEITEVNNVRSVN